MIPPLLLLELVAGGVVVVLERAVADSLGEEVIVGTALRVPVGLADEDEDVGFAFNVDVEAFEEDLEGTAVREMELLGLGSSSSGQIPS